MRRGRLAAEVSHELRAPLARLHTAAQLAARRARHGADVAEDLDALAAGIQGLVELMEDVLLSTGRRPTAPVDLAALADELVAAERPRAREHGVAIETVRHGTGGGWAVPGVAPALRRVLSALLDNALRHTAPGGAIRVTLTAGGGAVEVAVRDDGDGFDPRDAGRLLAGSGGRADGFGLGLALAREVVAGHGGALTADGRPGAGAVFTVRIPGARPSADGGV